MKEQKYKSIKKPGIIKLGIIFSLSYWFLESIRDVFVFEKGNLLNRIFLPDPMSFWMRFLVVSFLILFSIHAQSIKTYIKTSQKGKDKPLSKNRIIWTGLFFGIAYWIMEAVRDVIVFERSNIFARIFAPDLLGIWMRLLAVFIILLFSFYSQSLVNKQKTIEKRKNHLESLLYAAPDAIVTIDTDQCIIEWNRGSEQVFGYKRDEVIGKHINEVIIGPNSKEEMTFIIQKLLSGEKIHPMETVRYRKDGSSIDVITAVSPFQTEDDMHGAIMIFTDISEQKQMEIELRKLNRALKTLSQSNQVLVRTNNEQDLLDSVCQILVDAGGYSFAWVGYIAENNRKNVVPISKADQDDGYLDVVHLTLEDNTEVSNPANEAIQSGEPCITKYLSKKQNHNNILLKDIKQEYSSSISLPLLNQGVSFGALTIYSEEQGEFDAKEVKLLKELSEDLAFGIMVLRARVEHKKTEEEHNKMQMQLLQAQKMESIGIMAGGIAHDFNNLLTAIMGCVDLSLEEVNETDTIYRDLSEIRIAAQRAADLTKQLLLFSRKKSMKFKLVNMNSIIQDLLTMLKRLIGEDVQITTHLDPDLWTINADQGTLEQVIMNLAVNARDAMPEGGKLTIKTENLTLSEADKTKISEAPIGKCIHISVSDNGTGMDDNMIQHIYDPFYSTKTVGKGTGLGLSVVYGIVKQHDGCIQVESKINWGTKFDIYLPAHDQMEKEKPKVMNPKKKHQGENQRILVIEDEEKVREFTISGLSRSGYIVFSAANAQEAVDIFKKENGDIDVVISDVVLPGQSGIELVNHFRKQKPDISILLSSGYTDYQSRWPIIQENGFQFLEKPYTLNDLIEIIHKFPA